MSPTLLVLGLPRCGTQSIADALQILGYQNVYHMREVAQRGDQEKWIELLDIKSGKLPQEDSEDKLRAILKDFDAIVDFPASIFAEELLVTYPDAKVIVADRDEDKWFASMMNTLWYGYKNPTTDRNSHLRRFAERSNQYCFDDDFEANGRSFRKQYYERVRNLVSSDHRLEYRVQDGWAPLCRFLGKDVPDQSQPFPLSDAWAKNKWKRSDSVLDFSPISP